MVEVDGDILDGDRSPDLAAADRASDEIHHQLGRAAGEFLYQFVNGEHDTVAVGAGRGVHFTIRTLREQVEEHVPTSGVDWRSFPSSAPCGSAPIHSTSGPGSTSTPTNTLELADIFEVPVAAGPPGLAAPGSTWWATWPRRRR